MKYVAPQKGGTETCAGCSRSGASKMQGARVADVQHAGVARSENVVVEAWVGSSTELRDNWQRAGPANLASCLGDSIPVCIPWGITPSWSEAQKKGSEAAPRLELAARRAMP